MKVDLGDLNTFAAVAQAKGFCEGARLMGMSVPGLSEAVWRLETQLGVCLLNRMTCSVSPTETGQRLLSHLWPTLSEVEAAPGVVNSFRERPAGVLKLNVPMSAARLVSPATIPGPLDAYLEIQPEVVAEEGFADILAVGFDAGIRHDERFEQDMIAVPIGPRSQRFAMVATPGYLDRRGRPNYPRDLLDHACLRGRFASGATSPWELERDGEVANVDPSGPLLVCTGGAIDFVVDAVAAGVSVVHPYGDWLRPHLVSRVFEPVLEA